MSMEKGIDSIGIAVVFTCHDGQGNYLLAKRGKNCRDEQGRWDCGGGSVEFADSIVATLKKEIKEEYCTDMLKYEYLGYREVLREKDGKTTHWVTFDFKVLVDPREVGNGEPHKMDEIGWFRLGAFPEPLHSQYPYFLEKYQDRLV